MLRMPNYFTLYLIRPNKHVSNVIKGVKFLYFKFLTILKTLFKEQNLPNMQCRVYSAQCTGATAGSTQCSNMTCVILHRKIIIIQIIHGKNAFLHACFYKQRL